MIYYGTEQGLHGGDEPQNRETLWPYYNTDSELYKFISILAKFRTQQGSSLYESPQVECYADDQVYAFTRGMVSALLNASEMCLRTFAEHGPGFYPYNTCTKSTTSCISFPERSLLPL